MNRDHPVSVIEGIGPKAEERLRQLGIFSPFDLLWFRAGRIHDAVRSQASPEQVAAWRQAASLLQVRRMTGQWAEALVRAGIDRVQALAWSGLGGLRTLFGEALDSGIIPVVPTDDEMVIMLKDAVVIENTGALRGTVVDAAGEPLPGVSVRVGRLETVTDPRGRFDLLRIPLGTTPALILRRGEDPPSVISDPPISRDAERIDARLFRCLPPKESETGAGEDRSELAGDSLGTLAGRRVRTRVGERADLREDDILMVREYRDRDAAYRVVSKLKSLVRGELVVHAYDLPAALFETAASRGDLYRVAEGRLVRMEADRLDLRRYRRWLATRAATTPLPEPETDEDFRRYFEARLAALSGRGAFNRRQRGV